METAPQTTPRPGHSPHHEQNGIQRQGRLAENKFCVIKCTVRRMSLMPTPSGPMCYDCHDLPDASVRGSELAHEDGANRGARVRLPLVCPHHCAEMGITAAESCNEGCFQRSSRRRKHGFKTCFCDWAHVSTLVGCTCAPIACVARITIGAPGLGALSISSKPMRR